MKLTAAHVRFWQSKRAPMPASFARLVRMPPVEDVHWLINVQAGINRFQFVDASNLLNVLRKHRQRGEKVSEVLWHLAPPPVMYESRELTRLEANCIKWLRRIGRDTQCFYVTPETGVFD